MAIALVQILEVERVLEVCHGKQCRVCGVSADAL